MRAKYRTTMEREREADRRARERNAARRYERAIQADNKSQRMLDAKAHEANITANIPEGDK